MARGYRPVVRDQQFLLAPDMRDWLPADHLVWTVLDMVTTLDTSAFHRRARLGSVGRQGYDPDMMVGLLLYAYAVGVRSTRAIERLCATDVAFRIACAQDTPDHTALARFRKDHEAAFIDLFAKVLTVAARAGLAKFGTVAIDGTKIPGNASLDANRTATWVHAQAETIVAEAAAIDAAEDAAEAQDEGGGQPPPKWADHQARKARIEALVAELEQVGDTAKSRGLKRSAARHEADLAAGVIRQGRIPAGADLVATAQVRLAQALARQRAVHDKWQARVSEGNSLGRRPKPVEQHWRVIDARKRLAAAEAATRDGSADTPAIQQAADTLAAGEPAAGKGSAVATTPAPEPRVNLTDPASRIQKTRRGWVQGYNAQVAVTSDQIIVACSVGQNPADGPTFVPMMTAAVAAATSLAEATGRDTTIGTVLADAGYASNDNLTADGPDRLIALGKSHSLYATAKDTPASGPPDPAGSTREQMAHRLATPEGAALYKKRGATVEPGIGNLKKLLPRFSRRGLDAATAELNLAATAFNLLKIHRHAAA